MSSIRRHLSYANVLATLALVFAMSGSALAASHYLINSTHQINPKVLRKLGRVGPRGLQGRARPGRRAGLPGQGRAARQRRRHRGDRPGRPRDRRGRRRSVGQLPESDARSRVGHARRTSPRRRSARSPPGKKAPNTSCLELPLRLSSTSAPASYCLDLPFQPSGGAVSIDSGAAGFPVAFISTDPVEVEALCFGDEAVVTTFSKAESGHQHDERFHAILY